MERAAVMPSRRRCTFKQLLRVRPAHFAVRISAEHSRDLDDARCTLEHGNVSCSHSTTSSLCHDNMIVRASSYLGQMRDGKDLMMFRDPPKSVSHLEADLSSDSCINFIEYQRGHGISAGENRLECEHDPRELTP